LHSEIAPDRLHLASGQHDLRAWDALLVRAMPAGSLEQVVFRMDVLHQVQAGGVVVVNPPRAMEVAVDKYLALARLQSAGLPVPRTAVCQTVDEALAYFRAFGGDVVVKPVFGSEGRGIIRLSDEGLAWRGFTLLTQLGSVLYLQEYVEHGNADLRLLVVGDDVLAVRRVNPHDWRTNVGRGARAEPFAASDEVASLARRAARCVGATLAGIDLLRDRDGRWLIAEVNAAPGWQAVSRALDVDVARLILDHLQRLSPSFED
jgi:ribosomal protein S6--L-glutamate ligase